MQCNLHNAQEQEFIQIAIVLLLCSVRPFVLFKKLIETTGVNQQNVR